MRLIDVINSPWAITERKFHEIVSFYARHLGGPKIDFDSLPDEARAAGISGADDGRTFEMVGDVAVIPIQGVMTRRLSLFARIFGGMSTVMMGDAIAQAAAMPDVRAILLDVDSPGGEVAGTQELAARIRAARDQKPVVAYASGMMASAAYWAGSSADSVVISSDTTVVGSIGVVATLVDISKALDDFGVKVNQITAGRYKVVGTPYKPLSDEDRGTIQAEVDYLYSIFLANVAENRGTTPEAVHERMGDGRIFIGRQALDAGLADEMASFDDVIDRLQATSGAGGIPTRAALAHSEPAGGAPTASSASTSNEDEEMDYSALTLDALTAERPDLVEAITADARTAGATAERKRIQAVEAQALPGHEALIATLKWDGKTTGPEAAVQVLQAERNANAGHLQALQDDAPPPAPAAESGTAQAVTEDESLPLRDRCEATWKRDAKLRAEFGDDFEAYVAYRKADANGQVRYLRSAG